MVHADEAVRESLRAKADFLKLLKTLQAAATTMYLIALDKADGRTQNISASDVRGRPVNHGEVDRARWFTFRIRSVHA